MLHTTDSQKHARTHLSLYELLPAMVQVLAALLQPLCAGEHLLTLPSRCRVEVAPEALHQHTTRSKEHVDTTRPPPLLLHFACTDDTPPQPPPPTSSARAASPSTVDLDACFACSFSAAKSARYSLTCECFKCRRAGALVRDTLSVHAGLQLRPSRG